MTSMSRCAGLDRRAHSDRRGAGPAAWTVSGTGPAAAILMLGLLAACGGGDDGSSASATADNRGGAEQETQAAAADPLNIDAALLPEGVTVAMVEEGRELFNGGGICYTCHLEDATGGPLAPDLTDETWLNVDGEYASIVEVIKTGVAQPIEALGSMLPRAGIPLTDEQVDALAAYAYMLSRM